MTFLDEHLPKIHEIMTQVKVSGMPIDVTALNGLLATQLQKIINDKNFLNLKTTRPPKFQITDAENEPENINCQKCNRNCRKRAVQCDPCKWWIHYHCAKLEESEINNIESNKSYSYTCFKCNITSVPPWRLVLPAPYSTVSPNTSPKTLSQSILSEEQIVECAVCSTPFIDDEIGCEKCGSLCHSFCMCPSNSDICLTYAATNFNIQTTSGAETDQPVLPKNSSIITHSGGTSSTNVKTIINSLPRNDQSEVLKKKESELSQKQKDLRQLEMKLKKERGGSQTEGSKNQGL